MGTNYYAVRKRPTTERAYHIGKSSIGWLFNFQSQNEKWAEPPVVWNSYKMLEDWLKKYVVEKKEFVILNEYDQIISYDDFIKLVNEKQNDPFCRDNPDNFRWARNVDGYRFTDECFS